MLNALPLRGTEHADKYRCDTKRRSSNGHLFFFFFGGGEALKLGRLPTPSEVCGHVWLQRGEALEQHCEACCLKPGAFHIAQPRCAKSQAELPPNRAGVKQASCGRYCPKRI